MDTLGRASSTTFLFSTRSIHSGAGTMSSARSTFSTAVKQAFQVSHLGEQKVQEQERQIVLGSEQLSRRLREASFSASSSSSHGLISRKQSHLSRSPHMRRMASQRPRAATLLGLITHSPPPVGVFPDPATSPSNDGGTISYAKTPAKQARIVRPRRQTVAPEPQLGVLTQKIGYPLTNESYPGFPKNLDELYVHVGIIDLSAMRHYPVKDVNTMLQSFVCGNGMSAMYIMLLANRRGLRVSKAGLLRLDDVDKHQSAPEVARSRQKLRAGSELPIAVKELYCEVSGQSMADVTEKTIKDWRKRWPVSDHHLQRVIEGNMEDVKPVKLFDGGFLRRCTETTVENVLNLPKHWERSTKKAESVVLKPLSRFERWK